MKREYTPYSKTVEDFINEFLNDSDCVLIIDDGVNIHYMENEDVDYVSEELLERKVKKFRFLYNPEIQCSKLDLTL